MVAELIVSTGLFILALIVAVYLVRYSNQQLAKCLTNLESQHNELVDLNGKLAKEILGTDKRLRHEINAVKEFLSRTKRKNN